MSAKTDKAATKKEEAAEQEYLAKQVEEEQQNEVEVQKAPGKPGKPFQPGVDPVPVPNTVLQHPLFSDPGAAKPI